MAQEKSGKNGEEKRKKMRENRIFPILLFTFISGDFNEKKCGLIYRSCHLEISSGLTPGLCYFSIGLNHKSKERQFDEILLHFKCLYSDFCRLLPRPTGGR